MTRESPALESVVPADVVSELDPSWRTLVPDVLGSKDRLYVRRATGKVDGFACVREMQFDSDVFGIAVARVVARAHTEVVHHQLARGVLASASELGFRQLVTTLTAEDYLQLRVLEECGFRLVDVGLVFSRRLGRASLMVEAAPAELPVRVALEPDLNRLMEMAGALFRQSRFYRDPCHTAETADELHRRWIRNCLVGERADVVLVATDDADVPIAFVTCKVDKDKEYGAIDLVAVDPRYRGRGVATAVLGAALRWFAARTGEVRVKTQAINYGAARLYERAGFHLVSSDMTLTWSPSASTR